MALVLELGLAGCGSSKTEPANGVFPPTPGQSGFSSNGRSVRLEVVRSDRVGKRPAVIMLHGASGVGSGWLIYPYAKAIARRGIDVFIVHYFDGLDAAAGDRSGSRHFGARERVIRDALVHVGNLPDIDEDRIGLFGLSLGGFHALGLAAQGAGIAAVVDLMGAMPRSVPDGEVRRMPPTLILHGARDSVVPIERAAELALLLDRLGGTFEMKIYVNGAHTMSGPAHGNSIGLTADFFDRHLR